MKDSLVYCRLHFETLIQGDYQTHFNHAEVVPHKGLGSANTLGLSYFNGVGTVQKGRPRKRKSPGPGAELAAYNAGKNARRRLWQNAQRHLANNNDIFIWAKHHTTTKNHVHEKTKE